MTAAIALVVASTGIVAAAPAAQAAHNPPCPPWPATPTGHPCTQTTDATGPANLKAGNDECPSLLTFKCTREWNVTQINTRGGENRYVLRSDRTSATVSQQQTGTTDGQNNATIDGHISQTTALAFASQTYAVAQDGDGGNTIKTSGDTMLIDQRFTSTCPPGVLPILPPPGPTLITIPALILDGSVCGDVQVASQAVQTRQTSQTGPNNLFLHMLESQRTELKAILDDINLRPTFSDQESQQIVDSQQTSQSGDNLADIKAFRSQDARAKGAHGPFNILACLGLPILAPCVPAVTQLQNTDGGLSDNAVTVTQTTCPTPAATCFGTNRIKYDAPDIRQERGQAFLGELTAVLGESVLRQGHAPNDLTRVQLTQNDPFFTFLPGSPSTPSEIDVGTPSSTDGMTQVWTQESLNGLGVPAILSDPGNFAQRSNTSNLVVSGNVDNVRSNQRVTQTAPEDTPQQADLTVLGAALRWAGLLKALLISDAPSNSDPTPNASGSVEITGTGGSTKLSCTNNMNHTTRVPDEDASGQCTVSHP